MMTLLGKRLRVSHGREDILTMIIGRPEHLGRVCSVKGAFRLRDYFSPP